MQDDLHDGGGRATQGWRTRRGAPRCPTRMTAVTRAEGPRRDAALLHGDWRVRSLEQELDHVRRRRERDRDLDLGRERDGDG